MESTPAGVDAESRRLPVRKLPIGYSDVAKRFGIKVYATPPQRVMSRSGLTARIRQISKAKPCAERANKQPLPGNLLNREFNADRPMHRMVTDVTYVPYFENGDWHWGYLSLVQDLFDRSIVA